MTYFKEVSPRIQKELLQISKKNRKFKKWAKCKQAIYKDRDKINK